MLVSISLEGSLVKQLDILLLNRCVGRWVIDLGFSVLVESPNLKLLYPKDLGDWQYGKAYVVLILTHSIRVLVDNIDLLTSDYFALPSID